MGSCISCYRGQVGDSPDESANGGAQVQPVQQQSQQQQHRQPSSANNKVVEVKKVDPDEEEIIVPRSFRLLDELEQGEKAKENKQRSPHAAFCSYGLEEQHDNLTHWHGSIVGPQGERIYFLRIECGPEYPFTPCKVWFNTKVNIPCVDQSNGAVTNKLKCFKKWSREITMEQVLFALRSEIITALRENIKQPSTEETY